MRDDVSTWASSSGNERSASSHTVCAARPGSARLLTAASRARTAPGPWAVSIGRRASATRGPPTMATRAQCMQFWTWFRRAAVFWHPRTACHIRIDVPGAFTLASRRALPSASRTRALSIRDSTASQCVMNLVGRKLESQLVFQVTITTYTTVCKRTRRDTPTISVSNTVHHG